MLSFNILFYFNKSDIFYGFSFSQLYDNSMVQYNLIKQHL